MQEWIGIRKWGEWPYIIVHDAVENNVAQCPPQCAGPYRDAGGLDGFGKPVELVGGDFLMVSTQNGAANRRGNQCDENANCHGTHEGMGRAMKNVGLPHHANEGFDINGNLSEAERDQAEMFLCCGLGDQRRTHMERSKWHKKRAVQYAGEKSLIRSWCLSLYVRVFRVL